MFAPFRHAREIRAGELEDLIASAVSSHYPAVDQSVLRLAINLKRAANILTQRESREIFSSSQCSPAAVRALTMVWMFQPIEACDISRLSGYSRQAVSGVLARLERDGLVNRVRGCSVDKRLIPVSATDHGREIMQQVLPLQNRTAVHFMSRLDYEEQMQLSFLLTKLVVDPATGVDRPEAPIVNT